MQTFPKTNGPRPSDSNPNSNPYDLSKETLDSRHRAAGDLAKWILRKGDTSDITVDRVKQIKKYDLATHEEVQLRSFIYEFATHTTDLPIEQYVAIDEANKIQ